MKSYSKKQIREAIAYWKRRLVTMNESLEGMRDAQLTKCLSQFNASTETDGDPIKTGAFSFVEIVDKNGKNVIPTSNGNWLCAEYSRKKYGDVETVDVIAPKGLYAHDYYTHVYVIGKSATWNDLVKAGFNCPDNLTPEQQNKIMATLRGHTVSSNSLYRLRSALIAVNRHVFDTREKEKRWKKQTLTDIELNKMFGGEVVIPADYDESVVIILDRMFGGDAYEYFIPSGYEEIEGAQTDFDDWDVHKVCLQDHVDPDDFYKELGTAVCERFGTDDGKPVVPSEVCRYALATGREIAETAWENVELDDSNRTYRGHSGHSYHY